MATAERWLRSGAGRTGRALMSAGVFLVSRSRAPGKRYLSIYWECQRLQYRALDLLDEYKDLGEGGVTVAEGERMEEIITELRAIGAYWDVVGCSSIMGRIGGPEAVPAELTEVLAPPD